MTSKFLHANINVADLDKSIAFYNEALGLKEVRRNVAADGRFIIVFLGDGQTDFQLELTWLRDHPGKYNLGENESHVAFGVKDKAEALAHHKKMGCVAYENHDMNIYFIVDPDGYWMEVI